ncbi:peptidase [Actinoplanes sp. TBRC 11911]|uniref:peptidase n=1 Tax=Actinoplanes sp. TBRC 11911 TaxID=2729386 RepID=UPI00145F062B|nr:peptidase [Actinoplanes sp. TBRC 11911]NMO55677.1 peptidase [Actinoplanes sp. TBRC 11911]
MNRIGAGLAVLAAAALIGTPTVAYAAVPLPDLAVSFAPSAVEVGADGATVSAHVSNGGAVAASAVTLTLDLRKLSDAVVASTSDSRCTLKDEKVTCALGGIAAAGVVDVPALALERNGDAVGPAGTVAASVDGAEEDATPANDTASLSVTTAASGAELVVGAEDINTSATPVGPGDTKPFHGLVFNQGDTAATGATMTLDLRGFGAVAERYTDCTYVDDFPHDTGGEFVYGPDRVTCPLPELNPGAGLLFFNEKTGESAFNVQFGRNLPGPDSLSGAFSIQPGTGTSAAPQTLAKQPGPTFAEALARLQPATTARAQRVAVTDDLKSTAAFQVWTKANTLDVRATAAPVSGTAGQTVTLTYDVVNQGPSDGGGPNVLITAPSGTVLLPAKGCWTDGTDHVRRAESAKLRCTVDGRFPAVASGSGKVSLSVKLKIKSTPGTNGTVYAVSCCVGSTESNKANNTAKIVFSGGGGGTGTDADTDTAGGSGAGLPITGSPVALVALVGGVVLVLGVVLLLVVRRKRVS